MPDQYKLSFQDYSFTYHIKGFRDIHAVNDVSIQDITTNEIIIIVGPNGSGKSTLINLIVGRLYRERGDISFEINNNKTSSSNLRISYVPQKPYDGLVPTLSIAENILFRKYLLEGGKLQNKSLNDNNLKGIQEFLEDYGFEYLIDKLKMPVDSLSGGQQQILNILSALYAQPHLLVLDEPASKLDEINRIILWNLLVNSIHKQRMSLLCATHDLQMAKMVADRLVELNNGKIVCSTNLRQVLSDRFVGEIRRVNSKDDLPAIFKTLQNDWWKPGIHSLFDEDYYVGDDSISGHIINRKMSRTERTIREVNGVCTMLSLNNKKNIHILDAPCGWGRHSIELAQKGYNITGIDLSQKYINQANKAKTKLNITNADFLGGDLRSIPCKDEIFDYAINMWSSFGFFEESDNIQVLKEFYRVLKHDGRLLIYSDLNPTQIKKGIFTEPPTRTLTNGDILHVYEYYCEIDKSIYGSWKLDSSGVEHIYRIKIWDNDQWYSIAKDIGFTIEDIWGGFDKNDNYLTSYSQEHVVILRKK